MLFNSWSIGLSIISLCVLFLLGVASRTAVRVLRYWNPASDSARQISLENEIWLSSTLVAYGLGFQIISLLLFVLTADNLSGVIIGAMCATGSLLANGYGIPVLLMKIAGVFLYGFWLVLHRLDIRSEYYPLVKIKYWYLVLILPYLVIEVVLQTLFLARLSPEIITSCCAVFFGSKEQLGQNLLGTWSTTGLMASFYFMALVLSGICLRQLSSDQTSTSFSIAAGITWTVFFFLSLVVVTVVVSSYIYAMPYHHCPFCILKAEYHGWGYPIFLTLFLAVFAGLSHVIAGFCRKLPGLAAPTANFQRFTAGAALTMLLLFVTLASYHFWTYLIFS
ncbi:MAG: hypothetical protein V1706_16495 [Pseudomonadota bacterium]